jgi:hypothetical protein
MFCGRHGNRSGLYFTIGSYHVLDGSECAGPEFSGHGVRPIDVGIHDRRESNRLPCLLQLMVDASVVPPKSADADYGHVNERLVYQDRISINDECSA